MSTTVAESHEPEWIHGPMFDWRKEGTEFVTREYNIRIDEMEYHRFTDAASFKSFVRTQTTLIADSICRWADKQGAGNV